MGEAVFLLEAGLAGKKRKGFVDDHLESPEISRIEESGAQDAGDHRQMNSPALRMRRRRR